MRKELTCEQVCAIITFYAEGKLSETLQQAVKYHLDNCPKCKEKFRGLQDMIARLNKSECGADIDGEVQNTFKQKQYAEFRQNLSAYIDNELDDRENLRLKKITVSNPMARQALEEMYSFRNLLHYSFDKTKNDLKYDFSKNVLNLMYKEPVKKIFAFNKLVTAYCIMLATIVFGAVVLFNTGLIK